LATFWLALIYWASDIGYGISEVTVNAVERVLSGLAVRVQIMGDGQKEGG
jgi:hypothetical protein